jgi:Flp pilus assembly pilin Flp
VYSLNESSGLKIKNKENKYKGAIPVDIKSSRNLSNKKITGQGMSEYLVIVGLIAVCSVVAMGLMGEGVRNTFGAFTTELSGSAAADTATATGAGRAAAAGVTTNSDITLRDFDTRNP